MTSDILIAIYKIKRLDLDNYSLLRWIWIRKM